MTDSLQDDGAAVVSLILAAYPQLATGVLIKAGQLPEGFAPPALLVRTISSIERRPKLAAEPTELMLDRIGVTALAETYREQRQLISWAYRACANRIGTFGACRAVSVTPAGLGPDGVGVSGLFEQTATFLVGFERDV